MPTPTLETTPDGGLVIEADTAAEALDQVRVRLGDDAQVLDARKVHRGGWKGFFAFERVRLTARPGAPNAVPGPTPDSSSPPPAPVADPDPDGLAGAIHRLTQEAEREDRTFRDVLLEHVAEQRPAEAVSPGPAATPRPGPVPPDPQPPSAPDVAAPPPRDASGATPSLTPGPAVRPPTTRAGAPTPSGVPWATDRLEALRLPRPLVAACDGLDPQDEVAWLRAIGDVVVTWCRPLPTGDDAVVGPRAHRLGRGLGVPVTHIGGRSPVVGPVALQANDSDEGRQWVEQSLGGRWLHLVAGGSRWQAFLFDDALAVSWVGAEALPAALSVASRMGLVLGYGLAPATGPAPVRATPLDVALTIRSLLARSDT